LDVRAPGARLDVRAINPFVCKETAERDVESVDQPAPPRAVRAVAIMRLPVGAVVAASLCALPAAAGDLQAPIEVSSVADRALSARPGDSLLLVVGDRITTARVDRGGISTRGLSLRLIGDKLRGEVGKQRVEVELRGSRISGHIGTREIALEVSRSEGALKVTGQFGARAVSEALTPNEVTAEVGPCRYILKFQKMEYAGQIGCGGQPEPVHLRVPAALIARRDVEIAALFTALLAR
jgi:hypothetical protein